MNDDELTAALALTRVPGVGLMIARRLYDAVGSARSVFEQRTDLPRLVPDITPRLVKALDCPEAFDRAREELDFVRRHELSCFVPGDPDYPSRLRDCPDAPLVLFYKGTASLNAAHVVNIVGTRHATDYGIGLCRALLADLKALCPDVLVVSGLAYGIDICAHRAALDNDLDTVGVLAHGLNRIYPSQHRDTAARMTRRGGLLTEFPGGTNPDRQNFVRRNRIVAGISDATIVVESAAKGGALITAGIATDYGRECFACPGPVGAPYSAGCNNLIRDNGAVLLQSAEELVKAMNWNVQPKPKAVQRELFTPLTPDEQSIVDHLRRLPTGIQVNTLTVHTGIPINRLLGLLFELELKGIVAAQAGGTYRLL